MKQDLYEKIYSALMVVAVEQAKAAGQQTMTRSDRIEAAAKAALAALSQHATFPADIDAARKWLAEALANPGEADYAADLLRRPFYHDGTPRRRWAELSAVARWSWEHPTTSESPAYSAAPAERGTLTDIIV